MITDIFAQAHEGRMFIHKKMTDVITEPRKQLAASAPKIVVIKVPVEKIGEVIGPGGKNIRGLSAETKTEINIEDDGSVTITGVEQEGIDAAVNMIKSITKEPEVGEVYDGEVVRIMNFGAFVEILPGRDGMVHVSKMGKGFVKDPNDVVKVGQFVKVKVIQIDTQGRVNLEMITE